MTPKSLVFGKQKINILLSTVYGQLLQLKGLSTP